MSDEINGRMEAAKMKDFHFDRKKTIQAAAYILSKHPQHRMKYILLLKLLYIADRESLRKRLQPITGDTVYAMKHGPVLSKVKDMIDFPAAGWDDYILTEDYCACLKKEPETDRLSDFELEVLSDVAGRYAEEDEWKIVDLTHEFPEWIDHFKGDGRALIPVSDIARAVGRGADIEQIEEESEEAAMMAELFED